MNQIKHSSSSSSKGILCGLGGGILWALDTALLSLALAPFQAQMLAPLAAAGLHDCISSLIILLIESIRHHLIPLRTLFTDKSGRLLLLAGVLGGPIGMLAYVSSVYYLGPSLSAVFSCLYPVVGTISAVLFLKDNFSWKQGIGMVICICAVMVLSIQSSGTIRNIGLGIGMAVVCVLAWGIEGTAVQKGMASGQFSNEQALLVRQCTSASIYIALFVCLPFLRSEFITIVTSPSLLWLALAAASGTFSYLLYYAAIHLIGSPRAMPLNITYAAWALVFSFLFFGTIPSFVSVLCAIAAAVGAMICASA